MRIAGAAAFALFFAATAATTARAADYYASATGNPFAAGTLADPWNLQRALNNVPPVAPGDTVWVRGGVYLGPFTSYLKGAPGQPITVRNYDRERVIIDGQYSECNSSVCPPAEWQAQNPWYPTCPNANNEVHNRQCSGSGLPCDPDSDPTCVNYLDKFYNNRCNALNVPTLSHHVRFWGLEMMVAENGGRISPLPASCSAANPAPGCCWNPSTGLLHPECDSANPHIYRSFCTTVDIKGDDIQFVNSYFHDGSVGIPWFSDSENGEVYGSFSFNNGWVSGLRGHGHGTYNQNLDCTDRPSTKTYRDTVVFNNFDLGFQIYSAGCGPVNNFVLDGVVSFDNKMPTKQFFATADPTLYSQAPSYKYEFAEAIYIGSQRGARGVVVRNSHTFGRIDDVNDSGSALRIDSGGTSTADALVENNVFVGNNVPLPINNTALLRFTGNRVVGRTNPAWQQFGNGPLALIEPARGMDHLRNFHIEDNAYWWEGAGVEMRVQQPSGMTMVPFSAWQSTWGFDDAGTAVAGLPTQNWIYVRPNAYEPGRGNVVVYNWENLPAVTVDLSALGLAQGQSYKIHDVQRFHSTLDVNDPDYHGDVVASGAFSTATPTASISMAYADATPPIGFAYTVPSSLPRFGVFLVIGQ